MKNNDLFRWRKVATGTPVVQICYQLKTSKEFQARVQQNIRDHTNSKFTSFNELESSTLDTDLTKYYFSTEYNKSNLRMIRDDTREAVVLELERQMNNYEMKYISSTKQVIISGKQKGKYDDLAFITSAALWMGFLICNNHSEVPMEVVPMSLELQEALSAQTLLHTNPCL